MRLDTRVHLSYKDILLVPYDADVCKIRSRKDPDISSEICPGIRLKVPLVSSPMDTVTEVEMADAMSRMGALGILTRRIGDKNEAAKQVEWIKELKKRNNETVACALGVNGKVYEHAVQLCDAGANILCFDVANANHILVKEAVEKVLKLKDTHNLKLMVGNIATAPAAIRLADWGVDAIRVGTGSGSICSTRLVLAIGVPQLTAVLDCAEALKTRNVRLIADGGVRRSCDAIKGLWAGADTIMCGYVFSGTKECPKIDGKAVYRGMSSRMVHQRKDIAEEGVSIEVQERGSVVEVVREYSNAIQSACSFANANNLDGLRKNIRAIRVSTMSNDESETVEQTVTQGV